MYSGRPVITLCWITLFGIAVGYLESAVVVYLRELYYPAGFSFPLSVMSGSIGLTELLRELSTLAILVSIAHLAGNTKIQRYAWFFYTFAVWDIGYYIFLKLLVDWPDSLLTWDILFLIPTTWTGPVIAPIIVSLTMIFFAFLLLILDVKVPAAKFEKTTVILLMIGAGIVFLSFIWDYSLFMIRNCKFSGLFNANLAETAIKNYIPVHFNWWLFCAGLLIIYAGLFRLFKTVVTIKKVET
jgi:hypothetical protein